MSLIDEAVTGWHLAESAHTDSATNYDANEHRSNGRSLTAAILTGQSALVREPSDRESFVVALGGSNGASITFGPTLPRSVDDYEFVDFWMSIEAPGLQVKSLVRTLEGGTGPYCLGQFLRELAEDWRGERVVSEFEAIEHDLSIKQWRDSLGHVVLRFTLRESYRSDSWQAQVEASVDAGEAMSNFARDIQILLDDA